MLAEAVEVITMGRDVTAVLLVKMAEVVELVEAGLGLRDGGGMVVVVERMGTVEVLVETLLETVLVDGTRLERAPCIEAGDPVETLLVTDICGAADSLLIRLLLGELRAFWDAF